MLAARLRTWPVVAALLLLTGCASDIGRMTSELRQERNGVELVETPFHSQVTDQCGPSALATILNASGISITPEVLKPQVYIPGRAGSLQIELLAAARKHERIPYPIDPEITALLDELRDGRPVLILQNLGFRHAPIWHYAVVVGYLPEEKRLVLRSGKQKRHLMRLRAFIRAWRRAGYWGIVALQPGELPSTPSADRYIRSVASLEAIGDSKSAVSGYDAATRQWPQEVLAWLGLGNTNYALGDLDAAERAYRTLLGIRPDHAVALNNLSQVLADRGCYAEASATLDQALSVTKPDTAIYGAMQDTRRDIDARQSSAECSK